MPVIGYLSQRSPTDSTSIVAAFRQGLKEQGFVEGQNVTIESRFAEGQIDRLRHWRVIWFGIASLYSWRPEAPARWSMPGR
jgi:hypothetical protein